MFKFFEKNAKRKVLASLLALSVSASCVPSLFLPTQSFASELHPTGALMENEMPAFVTAAPVLTDVYLPDKIDFSYYYPIVGNQGSLGSCVAFATGYAALTYKKAYEVSFFGHYNNIGYFENDNNVFSPSYIYNQIHVDNSAGGGGAYVSHAFNLLREQGCATLADMPYVGTSYNYTTQPNTSQITSAAKNKIYNWEYLPSGNIEQMKIRLVEKCPIVITIPVFPDFDQISENNEVYDVINGTDRGLHALCLVGYDDEKQAFKFINSWGADWGLEGYGWISYDIIRNLYVTPYSFPVAPGNFRMTNGSGLCIQYTWNRIGNNKYAIYRRPTGVTEEFTKFMDTGTNNIVSIETNFGSYDYCVAIVDDLGNRISGFSRVSTAERFLNAPNNFRISNSSGLSIQFEWSRIINGEYDIGRKYAIYRRPTGSTEEFTKVIEAGTNNVVSVQTNLGSYDYCVASIDEGGYRTSYFSNLRTVER